MVACAFSYFVHVDYSQAKPEVTRMIWRVASVTQDGDALRAQVTKQWGAAAPQAYELRVDSKGAWDVADDPYFSRNVSHESGCSGVTCHDCGHSECS